MIADAARFELEQGNTSSIIEDKVITLQTKLDNESPFSEAEKAMMLMMQLSDLNLKARNYSTATKIFDSLEASLEAYSETNMPFYQYLQPSLLFRRALLLERTSGDSETAVLQTASVLLQIISSIEDYHAHSETLIEENIHLLGKVHEKLAVLYKKLNQADRSEEHLRSAIAVGE